MEIRTKAELSEEVEMHIVCDRDGHSESDSPDLRIVEQCPATVEAPPYARAPAPGEATSASESTPEAISIPALVESASEPAVSANVGNIAAEIPLAAAANRTQRNFLDSQSLFHPVGRHPRKKQIFNAIYFGAGTLALTALICSTHWHFLLPVLVLLELITCYAIFFAIQNRHHPVDFDIQYPASLRVCLRVMALLLPLPIIAVAAMHLTSSGDFAKAHQLYDQAKYDEAIPILKTALFYNGNYAKAQELLTKCYFYKNDYASTISSASLTLALLPQDADMMAEKSFALNHLGKYSEALPIAQQSVKIDPQNGQGYSSLAESNYKLGNLPAALAAADMHIKLHSTEAGAFESRSEILADMGRAEDAAADITKANQLTGLDVDSSDTPPYAANVETAFPSVAGDKN